MKYSSVKDFAIKWNIPERTIRNYCTNGKIEGAFLTGKTWNIPHDASLPVKKNKKENNLLLFQLKEQKEMKLKGGIYHRTQIDLTYNSNRIEGSQLSHEQTRYIFETNTIGITESINIDDIIETTNHFRCIDYIIDKANTKLTEHFIKELHYLLKFGTSDSNKDWFKVGDYKKMANEVGGHQTCPPDQVALQMKNLLKNYHSIENKTIIDIIDFHYKFEKIHPFQDGNGRVGRLIMFKECLVNNIVPFIINESIKFYYYRGLNEWENIPEYLTDTCLSAQDNYKNILNYFKIPFLEN
ncbi:Fic family protein [Flavobacterium azooxidireducens]|uniref:Fic family protein n=1 Tax=Flavobacterium azooxidireducens TaxID=1871076 RepID=A0ABY4KCF2_9FLAO|nr:Fic family protein [Flavobacterium azooxidireducens]UPQ78462.1 Fic family protein [Flavobacterium azooxidireducens]